MKTSSVCVQPFTSKPHIMKILKNSTKMLKEEAQIMNLEIEIKTVQFRNKQKIHRVLFPQNMKFQK